jgi:hypothetical protein
MAFAYDDDVIDAFPADRTDQPFSISVLPWGARRRRPITNAHGSKSSDEDLTIGPIEITRANDARDRSQGGRRASALPRTRRRHQQRGPQTELELARKLASEVNERK